MLTVTRRGSFSAHHAMDNDKKQEKKNKTSEKASQAAHLESKCRPVIVGEI